jgi:hypothetical protein
MVQHAAATISYATISYDIFWCGADLNNQLPPMHPAAWCSLDQLQAGAINTAGLKDEVSAADSAWLAALYIMLLPQHLTPH